MEILSLAKPQGGLEQLLLSVSASRNLTIGDHSRLLEVDSATPVTLTVPAGLPVGMTVLVSQRGAGPVSLAAGAGVVLRGELTLAGQYALVRLIHRGGDEWWVVGPTGLPQSEAFVYSGGDSLTLSRQPIGAVALYWAPSGGALTRVHPSRYSVSGKTLTLTAGQWSDLQSGDALVADYLGGAS